MNAVTHHFPLAGGAQVSAPVRRARVDVWAAPDPAQLVVDPWAAPVGTPIAHPGLSPWSAPNPASRITWMAAPEALLPAPGRATVRAELEDAADRALDALRPPSVAPFSKHPTALITVGEPVSSSSLQTESALPAPGSDHAISARAAAAVPTSFPPPDPASIVGSEPVARGVRWRLVALVGAVSAATAAGLAVLVSVL